MSSVVVRLAHLVYMQSCIEEAIEQYKPYCEIKSLSRTANETVLAVQMLSSANSSEIVVVHEFLNYVLDLSIRLRLRQI